VVVRTTPAAPSAQPASEVASPSAPLSSQQEALPSRPLRSAQRQRNGYRRLRKNGELPRQDIARSYVLDAVDRARDRGDLHECLATQGVVVKLVQRGGRVTITLDMSS
jgi:hypothetical protein